MSIQLNREDPVVHHSFDMERSDIWEMRNAIVWESSNQFVEPHSRDRCTYPKMAASSLFRLSSNRRKQNKMTLQRYIKLFAETITQHASVYGLCIWHYHGCTKRGTDKIPRRVRDCSIRNIKIIRERHRSTICAEEMVVITNILFRRYAEPNSKNLRRVFKNDYTCILYRRT